jgi:hypothetical protein
VLKPAGLVVAVSLVGALASPVAATRLEAIAGSPTTDPGTAATTTEAPPTTSTTSPADPTTPPDTTPPTNPTTPPTDPTTPQDTTPPDTAPPTNTAAPTDPTTPPSDQNVAVEWTAYDDIEPALVGDDTSIERRISQDFPGPVLMTGLSWASGDPHAVWLQTQVDGVWGEWETMTLSHSHGEDPVDEALHEHDDESATEGDRPGTDAIVLIEPDAFRFLVEGPIDDALAFVFRDQQSSTSSSAGPQGIARSTALVSPALPASASLQRWPGPSFVRDRSSWDTTNCAASGATFTASSSRAVIVHHTAGSNSYTADQVPGVLRGLCAFSVGSRGFDDVGYNFVVDRFGTVWEGRTGSKTSSIRGAHALAVNSQTQGVVLLGNYTTVSPSAAQLGGLRSILDWLTGWHGIDPTADVTLVAEFSGAGHAPGEAITVDGVAGHREVGQTACPGDQFFPDLRALAASVQPTDFGSTVSVSASSAGTKPVGALTRVWGRVNGYSGGRVFTQVLRASGWSTSQIVTSSTTGYYQIPLTFGANTPGTYTWRVGAVTPSGVVYSEPFDFVRTALSATATVSVSASSAGTKPVGALTRVWGRVTGYSGGRVFTQVLRASGWSTSQIATSSTTGYYQIPLTFGANTPGTYTWRVGAVTPSGVVYSDTFTLTRV